MTPPRLLVVEDEPKVARFIVQGLREEGHGVDLAETVAEARALLIQHSEEPRGRYGLLILDWMLPDGDGLDLARLCRQRALDLPILMLTARDAVSERVTALDAGADDYLVKPFAFAELLARVRALLRRSQGKLAMVSVDRLEMDLLARTARIGDTPLSLTTREFTVLAYLARHPGRAVSRTELLSQVWSDSGDVAVTANVVDVQIARLRDKLDAAGAPDLIQTVRRFGYMVGAPLAPSGDGTEEPRQK